MLRLAMRNASHNSKELNAAKRIAQILAEAIPTLRE
jgi:hypothetical protein